MPHVWDTKLCDSTFIPFIPATLNSLILKGKINSTDTPSQFSYLNLTIKYIYNKYVCKYINVNTYMYINKCKWIYRSSTHTCSRTCWSFSISFSLITHSFLSSSSIIALRLDSWVTSSTGGSVFSLNGQVVNFISVVWAK